MKLRQRFRSREIGFIQAGQEADANSCLAVHGNRIDPERLRGGRTLQIQFQLFRVIVHSHAGATGGKVFIRADRYIHRVTNPEAGL